MKHEVLFRVASRLATKYEYQNRGPWDNEDDEESWTTAVGLKAVIERNPNMGTWNVYVEVPEGNPGHKRSDEELKERMVGDRNFEAIDFSGRMPGMPWAFGMSFDHYGHAKPSYDVRPTSVYVTQEEAKKLGEKMAVIISQLTEDSFKTQTNDYDY